MTSGEEKWLKFHDNQYQSVPFMLHVNFESILKLVDEQYRDEMNQMNTKRKGNPAYIEKINSHVPRVSSTLGYGDVFNPMKIYHCKDCV